MPEKRGWWHHEIRPTPGSGGGHVLGWPAHAVDAFEIQVYEGDINRPLQAGLELHSNVTVPRESQRDWAGMRGESFLRVTFEPSFGLLEWWEVGAYVQLALALGDTRGHFGGFKLRSKWIVPRRLTGDFIVGLNVEVGRGAAVFEAADWTPSSAQSSCGHAVASWRPPTRWLAGP